VTTVGGYRSLSASSVALCIISIREILDVIATNPVSKNNKLQQAIRSLEVSLCTTFLLSLLWLLGDTSSVENSKGGGSSIFLLSCYIPYLNNSTDISTLLHEVCMYRELSIPTKAASSTFGTVLISHTSVESSN
jgi:hypothetical protein